LMYFSSLTACAVLGSCFHLHQKNIKKCPLYHTLVENSLQMKNECAGIHVYTHTHTHITNIEARI
jgi:hypothetical protein